MTLIEFRAPDPFKCPNGDNMRRWLFPALGKKCSENPEKLIPGSRSDRREFIENLKNGEFFFHDSENER